MIEDKTDFDKVVDFGNLYQAYLKSKSGKGFSKSSQKFQVAALDGIYQIKRRLETKTYQVSKYNEFAIYEPKERIIKACSFVDKIVQHSLCDNVLIPRLSTEFIQTNFAGQIGKGTLYGLDCLKAQMFLAYQKYGYDCWIVKADISKFFYNIDHNILKDIVGYFIEDKNVYWLCEKFIDSTEGLGIPLGNQVSQVYALLYLSGLDHFITGELGVKYYGRYMDDFYLIVQSKEYAKWCLDTIYGFVDMLGLELNGKTQIIPFKNGIKFCGFHTYVTLDGKVIRKLKNENKHAAKKKFKKMIGLVRHGILSKDKFYDSYNAWKNHISHGNCVKLGYEMDRYVEELFNTLGYRGDYMRAEDQLQYMADFYPELFPTRKHALNFLFCVLGNGFDWVNGELVDDDSKYVKRYKLRKPIERAEFTNEQSWLDMNKFYKELYEGEENKIPWKYDFKWYDLTKDFANLYNYPDDIKPDWRELLEECKSLLIADGIEV